VPRQAPAPEGLLSGIRVLAVDDDADSRELLLLTVRSAGAEVMVVSSGTAALDALGSFDPTVIVTDIAMPGLDGYGLIKEVKSRLAGAAPPALALSAYLQEGDGERATAAGFARHMAKPADYDHLVHAIADLAQNRARVNQ
jgi:CheY-like chemotaxis protein